MTGAGHEDGRRLSQERTEFLIRATATVAIAVSMAALAFLLWWVRNVVLLVFAGTMLAIFLQGLSERLRKWSGISYRGSLVIVICVLVVATSLSAWLVGAQVHRQVSQLIETLPESLHTIRERMLQSPGGRWLLSQTSTQNGTIPPDSVLPRLSGATTAGLSFVGGVAVILFVGLYGAIEPHFYRSGILHLVPKPRRARAQEVLEILHYSLWWWMLSRLASMFVVGVATTAALWALGVPMPFALGFIAFTLEVIPNLGPVLAAVPALLAAWPQGTQMVGYVTLLYVAVQTIDSYILLPWLERRTVYQPPILSIASVVLFAVVSGVLGAFVAAPLMVTVIVLVKLLYVESSLGDYAIHIAGEEES